MNKIDKNKSQICSCPNEQSTLYHQTTCAHKDDAMNTIEGIGKFRDKGSKVLLKELNQLHE